MFGAVLSALVSCFFAVLVNGSLEAVHGSSSRNVDHGLTSAQHPSDPIRIIRDAEARVNNDTIHLLLQSPTGTLERRLRRLRRDDDVDNGDDDDGDDGGVEPMTDGTAGVAASSSFSADEVRWSNINEEVDMVIPMVLAHLQKLGLAHLNLPDMTESLSVRPLFITYSAGLWLNNGLVYNLAGIKRTGDALMTYSDKSFICRFYLLIRSLQFDYDFLIKLMAIEGYGKVVGSLDDTVIYADLSINVEDTRLRLNDFRIVKFRNIHVELSQRRFIQELTGVILSPITNLFRDRITTSISDGLKDQMQGVMDDFNNKDPLELRTFAKQMLAGLTGQRR